MYAMFITVSNLVFFCIYFFFFNDTATTEIYTLSLHDALPISGCAAASWSCRWTTPSESRTKCCRRPETLGDRKSTRLNSSHSQISYAVFCLKKKNQRDSNDETRTNPKTDVRESLISSLSMKAT